MGAIGRFYRKVDKAQGRHDKALHKKGRGSMLKYLIKTVRGIMMSPIIFDNRKDNVKHYAKRDQTILPKIYFPEIKSIKGYNILKHCVGGKHPNNKYVVLHGTHFKLKGAE